MAKIYPSLLAADPLRLGTIVELLDDHCDGFHLDIMDNHLAPSLAFGVNAANALAHYSKKQTWIHLMVNHPLTLLEQLTLPTQSIVSFHFESKDEHLKTINFIKEKKWLPGIATTPKTAVEELFPFAHLVYQLMPMSVAPGFAGQKFISETLKKIQTLAQFRMTHNLNFVIGADGGITKENIADLVEMGVDECAIAQALFGEKNYIDATQTLRRLAT